MRQLLVRKQRKEIRRQKKEIEFLEFRMKDERRKRIETVRDFNRRQEAFDVWMKQIVEQFGEVKLTSNGKGVEYKAEVIDNEDGTHTMVFRKAEG